MKLLIILLCIASERYLIHAAAEYRRTGFDRYYVAFIHSLSQTVFFKNPYLLTAAIILPLLFVTWLVLTLFQGLLFGFILFIINFVAFYFSMGSANPFYPTRVVEPQIGIIEKDAAVTHYFIQVNNQLFAPIFWFIVTGALGVIAYRALSFCTEKEPTRIAALKILSVLDWITVRITGFLYLIVGNFQKGFQYYTKMMFTPPENNKEFLKNCGLLAADMKEGEELSLPYAQILVEHALIVCLVLLAFFTLVAWL